MIDASALFAAEGPLARALPGFRPRPQQVRMAGAVQEALAEGRHLLVEAGTGIGKSLAYLAPAIAWVADGRDAGTPRRVVVSTFTRALQEQLSRKDLPLLERAFEPLDLPVRHAILMGSENYLCLQRLSLVGTRPRLPEGGEAPPATLEALERHAASAVSGLRSEIPFAVGDRLWTEVRRDRDVCLGARGPFWDQCLYRRDLIRARESEILVVNHALYFLDLATGGRILPPHDAVILDEAHRVEEAAAAQFGAQFGPVSVARLLRDLEPARGPGRKRRGAGAASARAAVRAAARDVEAESDRFFAAAQRAAIERAARGRPPAGPLSVRLPAGALPEGRLRPALTALAEALADAAPRASEAPHDLDRLALAERARDLAGRAGLFLAQSLPDQVFWADTHATRGGAVLHAAPVEVGPRLRQRLFESGRTAILTSATLTASRSFAHLRARLGITTADETALGSPFDYARQALLYTADDLPDPGSQARAWSAAVAERTAALVEASDGGALVLFTSYALLEQVHEHLAPRAAAAGRPLLRHVPDGTATTLLEEFRAARRAILLGALTFWQGVDVPGEALRLVVLTRLPFDIPDHPVAEARGELIRARGGDPFLEDSLPDAILTFRQGFGRLIRSHEDRGVVAILDPRVATRGYGAAFLESLPACPRTASIDAVAAFYRRPPPTEEPAGAPEPARAAPRSIGAEPPIS